MSSLGTLAEYPGLADWFRQRTQMPSDHDVVDLLVWRTCDALSFTGAAAVKNWVEAFRQFLRLSTDVRDDFLKVDMLMGSCDAPLLDLLGDLGHGALAAGLAEPFGKAMKEGAERSGLVVLRFLAAWSALNSGQLEACIEACDGVDEPYGPIYTVHGQALLELGRVEAAAEVLEVAVALSPSEILAWFQLAKCRHVLGQLERALAALKMCRRLAPQSDEVNLYVAMVTLELAPQVPVSEHQLPYVKDALAPLALILTRHTKNPLVLCSLLRLACRADERPTFVSALSAADWAALSTSRDWLQSLTPLLRELPEANWLDMAALLLDHATGVATAS